MPVLFLEMACGRGRGRGGRVMEEREGYLLWEEHLQKQFPGIVRQFLAAWRKRMGYGRAVAHGIPIAVWVEFPDGRPQPVKLANMTGLFPPYRDASISGIVRAQVSTLAVNRVRKPGVAEIALRVDVQFRYVNEPLNSEQRHENKEVVVLSAEADEVARFTDGTVRHHTDKLGPLAIGGVDDRYANASGQRQNTIKVIRRK